MNYNSYYLYRIPKEPRPDIAPMRKFNLGPGQYELESIFENKRKSKGHKFSLNQNQRSPRFVEPHLR